MSSDVEEAYNANKREIIYLYDYWSMFRQLFVEEQTIALLWRSAPSFFYLCHYAFLHQTILNICRLTDPAKSGSHVNISLGRLVNKVKEQLLEKEKDGSTDEIDQLWKDVGTATKFARETRNKLLAHSDLETYRTLLDPNMEEVTREKIGAALKTIVAVINKVENMYSLAESDFSIRVVEGDANALIARLLKADA